jgi:uncharacterized protein
MVFKSLYRNLIAGFGVALAILLTIQPGSFAQSVNDWQSPAKQSGVWISDRAEIIPGQTERDLNRRIDMLTGRTTAELAIATIPKLETGQSVRAFALNLFNAWGIGDLNQNNGVLLFVSKADRRIEIITGKGLSEILPDREVSRLIQQEIVPAFRQEDYARGIEQGTEAIAQQLESQLSSFLSIEVSQILAAIGLGFVLIGYLAIALFRRIIPNLSVPTQGMNQKEFQFDRSIDWLSRYTLPELLGRLFNPRANSYQTPWLGQICLWLGGTFVGIAIALGFHSLITPTDFLENWYVNILSFLVYFIASLWGMLLPAFLQGLGENWFILLYPWTIIFISSSYLATGNDSWQWVLGVTLIASLMNIFCWIMSSGGDGLTFSRQWRYISNLSKQPPQELTADEIESVLDPTENLAASMGNLLFRGWREPTLLPPLTREQVYLVQASNRDAIACEQCQALTVEKSLNKVQKTIQTKRKVKGKKQKQPVDTLVDVEQTVYTCLSCGYVKVVEPLSMPLSFDHYVAIRQTESTGSNSSYDSSSNSSSSSDYGSSYDNTTYSDNSSSSDFGGGSSDGGGAGSDW